MSGAGHGTPLNFAPRFPPLLVLLAACAAVLIPGLFTLPPIDRDEARFIQASRQMAHTRDFVVPMVQDRPRLNKPPLIYWLQAGSALALTRGDLSRDHVAMYRVPGVLSTIAACFLTFAITRSMFDGRIAFIAGVMIVTCPLVVFDAHQARADQLLLALTLLAQWTLWRFLQEITVARAIALGLAIGLGILAKGPLTPMVVILTWLGVLALSRRWPTKQEAGLFIVATFVSLLPIGLWALAVIDRVGWERYSAIINDEVVGRSMEAKEGHWGPPGYHLALLIVLFFAGSMVTGLGVVDAWKSRSASDHAPVMFLLAWVLPSWIIFELVSTKLPHYPMVLYPALAILSARVLIRAEAGLVSRAHQRLAQLGYAAWCVFGFAIASAPLVVVFSAHRGDISLAARAIAAGLFACAAICLVAAAYALTRKRLMLAWQQGTWSCVISLASALGVVLPARQDLWVAQRAGAAIARADVDARRPVAAVEYHEDSLIFLTRGRIERIGAEELSPWLIRNPEGLVLLPRERAKELRIVDEVSGFNYSRGKRSDLVLAEAARAESAP